MNIKDAESIFGKDCTKKGSIWTDKQDRRWIFQNKGRSGAYFLDPKGEKIFVTVAQHDDIYGLRPKSPMRATIEEQYGDAVAFLPSDFDQALRTMAFYPGSPPRPAYDWIAVHTIATKMGHDPNYYCAVDTWGDLTPPAFLYEPQPVVENLDSSPE
jgi:hypothetical protein